MTPFPILMKNDKIYTPDTVQEFCDIVGNIPIIRTNKKIDFLNVPCSFDIETTSFYEDDEKKAVMYEWTFGINGAVLIGRTWEEFTNVLEYVSNFFRLSGKRRMIVYVHNLSFEFQFLRKWLTWENVFALDTLEPCYAVCDLGFEFRCSYILSGYSLDALGKKLSKYHINKLVGDLDYTLKRHTKTVLTEKELSYCVNDVRVVMAYIQEKIETDGDITKIQLTKTGYVRKYCRDCCLYETKSHKKSSYKFLAYRKLMKNLTLDVDEYRQLKRAFQGGFTHANGFCVGKTLTDIKSYDFTSSYPAVMVSEKFPMSHSETIEHMTKGEFYKNLKLYCCVFDVEFLHIEATQTYEHYISSSRCWKIENFDCDNGRVIRADLLCTTITEQDFYIIEKFYKWDDIKIKNFRRYRKGYLPKNLILAVLTLYKDKTTLKGVEGCEDDYILKKELLNSVYGMCVTDICRDIIEYSDEWNKIHCDYISDIEKYNKSVKRFLFYPWGVWVCAYARKNLFTAIYECKSDYIYSDTDSVKIKNYETHEKYFNSYNRYIQEKLKKACCFHNFDLEYIKPKTSDGIMKPLGVWDDEGVYAKFKTLGAKRYITEKDDKISITVSGLNKNFAVPYMLDKFKNKIFDRFCVGMHIEEGHTGKLTHSYIDESCAGIMEDYNGVYCHYYEKSFVHLEACDYTLSLSKDYIDYLFGIQTKSK